ncbi:MAG: NifB/NifX family molybdenum-iron cluster-binding protein, partial [Coriobacteriia bacterium]|nr:NifB/NifX family molybdenum-iron cluster-binding protein [Coriobacteriia bacterium]
GTGSPGLTHDKEVGRMGDCIVLAVPSTGDGGMDVERSGHFGRCDCFTVVDIAGGAITGVRVVDNPPHVDGGCLTPVNLLASHGVTALVVAGIGGRPLAGFNDAGITVYFDDERPMVRDAVEALIAGEVEVIDPGRVCGGH